MKITGRTTEFTQMVEFLQIERRGVEHGSCGTEVAMKVPEPVRRHDQVFRIHMREDTVETSTARLCLEPCPRCRSAKFSGGVWHLPSGQTGSHERSAVSGEIHRWR